MKYFIFILSLAYLLLSHCTSSRNHRQNASLLPKVQADSLNLYDSTRNRSIPVVCYHLNSAEKSKPVVIFSHGYGGNRGGDNVAYTYLTETLAAAGYFVASIQHELPTDDTLPRGGIPKMVRKANWERGVQNIHFTIKELQRVYPKLNYRRLSLIGHSNGGDMTMLFAHTYPNLIQKAISLDNRRMDLPLTNNPRIYSLRSSDMPADEGVIPSLSDQKKYQITVIYLPNTPHNNMDNNANEAQGKEIVTYLLKFLK
ncbi:MAG: alpha/beta hydrolase family protein [Bacteroidia bacterium]